MKPEVLALPDVTVRASDFVALTKPRLNFLVVVTATVGYYLGSGGSVDMMRMVAAVVGTALVAGGASATNQLIERDVDGLMRRTAQRPLPDRRLMPADAAWFAGLLVVMGLLLLAVGANPLAALVAFSTLTIYTVAYTPLKRRTSFATVVGAVPGALPPMIGWAAARGTLDVQAWILVAIVFLWQMPHFLAIAWIYREDYARAGFPLLPVVEPDGRSTGRQVMVYAAALLPVSLLPAPLGLAGSWYVGAAFSLGMALFVLGARFARRRTTLDARWLFVGSITYLPLLWIAMLTDRVA